MKGDLLIYPLWRILCIRSYLPLKFFSKIENNPVIAKFACWTLGRYFEPKGTGFVLLSIT